MTEEGAGELARRARGTPRVANRLLRRVRDYAEVRAEGVVDGQTAQAALEMLDVDEYGLDEMDARVLRTIIEKFGGGPVGVASLAVALGEDAGTLEEVYEPFLIQEGLLMRSPRGRIATPRAYDGSGTWRPGRARRASGRSSAVTDLSRTDAYDYRLDDARIARYPVARRDGSRLLAFRRGAGGEGKEEMRDLRFRDLPGLIPGGDLLV